MKPNKQRPILDIAILTAGRWDLFDKCVNAILTQYQPEYRIYVCNNGHPAPEYEQTYRKLPQNSVIKRNNTDGGFPVGANTCINAGNSPLVFFITDDVFIHDGVIVKLIETMKDENIGQCGYKLLFPENSTEQGRPAGKVQHVGMASNIRGDMIHPLVGWSSDHPKCNISREVLAVTGASFIIRRTLFNQVRGFNPIYGKGYYEDMELSFSLRSLGKKIWVNTEAIGTHGVGQTFKNEKTPPPLQQNKAIFKSRWMDKTPWTEFIMW